MIGARISRFCPLTIPPRVPLLEEKKRRRKEKKNEKRSADRAEDSRARHEVRSRPWSDRKKAKNRRRLLGESAEAILQGLNIRGHPTKKSELPLVDADRFLMCRR